MNPFLSQAWVDDLIDKLNSDEQYGRIAKNWEGDMLFIVEPDTSFQETVKIYLDLWHGKCRGGSILKSEEVIEADFTLRAPYTNFMQVLTGEVEPMRALLTRKLSVQGKMAVLMRNIPTVLDFVRCCREVTPNSLGYS